MGLTLPSPIVHSSSPLSESIDNIRQLEDNGAGAVVLWSIFEEQFSHDQEEMEHYLHYGSDRFAESLTYFPTPPQYSLGPAEYLDHIRKAKESVDIPIIASINGVSLGGWIEYAKEIQAAGADAIELNIYHIPASKTQTSAAVEENYLSILKAVKENVTLPVAMKLSPFFSSMANMLWRLDEAGADGLVLFNRFFQPDLDVENLEVVPRHSLSAPDALRLPLRWIAILHGQLHASLAGTTGIYTGIDAAKMIMAGADVAMVCSALLKNGVPYVRTIRRELEDFMRHKEYDSVAQMKGVLSQKSCPDPTAFERANYLRTLSSFGNTATLE
jgi:dihydroorotate dehydrogenase (fumarate)